MHVNAEGAEPQARLVGIANRLRAGESTPTVTVREFLRWFGTRRRGYFKVRAIQVALDQAWLRSEPDFEAAYIDSEITFALQSLTGNSSAPLGLEGSATATLSAALVGGAVADPTYRIGRLAAANNPPLSVKPDSTLQEVVTLLLINNYSQLPVMQSERDVKGVVSWTSIGARLALARSGDKASDFMESHREIEADRSLFDAIGTIVDRQYVLIRAPDKTISGIVTASDLSLQFRQLAEPFLLLGEIENHIRRLIDGKFTTDQVKEACDPSDAERQVESVADLTFGEYVRLLQKPVRWTQINLAVDRARFIEQLERIRKIRNDVMHFDPDAVAEEDLSILRTFVRFLQTLQDLGAT